MEIGALTTELGTPGSNPLGAIGSVAGGATVASGGLYGVQDVVNGWVTALNTPVGAAGGLGAAQLTLQEYGLALRQLAPGANDALATAAAAAAASAATAATTVTADDSALIAAQAAVIQLLGTELAASTAQDKILAGWPEYGGSFAEGGVVPGPAGMPRTIVAHGGEEYLGVGQHAAPVEVHIHGKGSTLEDLIDVRVQKGTRKISKRSSTGLPSRGGR
jgi:hypothetical protein